MLHIGICDDNQKDISRVQELAVRFSEQHPEMPIQIQAYSSPYDLLDEIEKTGIKQVGLTWIYWMSLCHI